MTSMRMGHLGGRGGEEGRRGEGKEGEAGGGEGRGQWKARCGPSCCFSEAASGDNVGT